jgi:hypothetical protein
MLCAWRCFTFHMQGPALSGQNSPWCVTRIVCNYVIGLLALFVAAAVQRWVLSHGVAAAQEWQQSDPETGVHAEVGPSTVIGRPLGPFTAALYPNPVRASPVGSSTRSTDSAASTSSGGDGVPVRDVAMVPDGGAAAGMRRSWWQLQMPKTAAGSAAAAHGAGA